MAEEKQKLSVDEQESIAEALLRLVASFDGFPSTITQKNIFLDDLKDAESIGIYPISGAVVLKKYVSGSFEAQFPFVLYYKCNPTNNAAVIEKREVLNKLAKWLGTTEYPALSDGRTIKSIERTTPTTIAGKDAGGNSIFQCGCKLKYFKKRS